MAWQACEGSDVKTIRQQSWANCGSRDRFSISASQSIEPSDFPAEVRCPVVPIRCCRVVGTLVVSTRVYPCDHSLSRQPDGPCAEVSAAIWCPLKYCALGDRWVGSRRQSRRIDPVPRAFPIGFATLFHAQLNSPVARRCDRGGVLKGIAEHQMLRYVVLPMIRMGRLPPAAGRPSCQPSMGKACTICSGSLRKGVRSG
jgi:hypothetical protein